jgi:DNA-directed RNA polymerase subunit RPC12/RpoP
VTGCWVCNDHQVLVDPSTGEEVRCPECSHDCEEYEQEVGTYPARNGAFQYWTRCARCGRALTSRTWTSVL